MISNILSQCCQFYLFPEEKFNNLQYQTFTCEDKGGTRRSSLCSSSWTDGLYGWNWEFHWCQCQFSQVDRGYGFSSFCWVYELLALCWHLIFWLSILKQNAFQTAQDTIRFLSVPFNQCSINDEFCIYKIHKIECSKYRWVFT